MQAAATSRAVAGDLQSSAAHMVEHAPLRLGLLLHPQRLYVLMKAIQVPLTAFGRTSTLPALPAW